MPNEQISICWKGSFSENHSFGKVNRNIRKQLQNKIEIELLSINTDQTNHTALSEGTTIHDISIYHQWPPHWKSPKSKYWVTMQPWEFGAVPKSWLMPMKFWTDEIWVYSHYNKENYVRCGIPEHKIRVIPLGVDEKIYHNQVEPFLLQRPSFFHFLFVGGTIPRKGIDLLLAAYLEEFSADEDVCLVIKDSGSNSFYKDSSMAEKIYSLTKQEGIPRIEYMDDHLSEQELASLYRACDCLVHPYRGEGFGLPIIEAMACGTPAIVPNKGPSQDFCDEETAFFLSAKEEILETDEIDGHKLIQNPWWLHIEQAKLQKMMRYVYENRNELDKKGKLASKKILSSFTWKQTGEHITVAVKELLFKTAPNKMGDHEIVCMELLNANEAERFGRLEEAQEILKNVLQIYPQTIAAHYHLAKLLMGSKRYVEAIQHLVYVSRSMDQESKSFQAEIWSLLGTCYIQIQVYQTAVQSFQKASELNPSIQMQEIFSLQEGIAKTKEQLATLYHRLGNCYSEQNNLIKAEEMLEKAVTYTSNPTLLQNDLEKNKERIQQKVESIQEAPSISIASIGIKPTTIYWKVSPLYPLQDDLERIKQRQQRWESYFVKGDRILQIQWNGKTNGNLSVSTKGLWEGILIQIKESPSSTYDLLELLKQTYSLVTQTGKLLFLLEDDNSIPDPSSLRNMVEMMAKIANWKVKESHTMDSSRSFYLILEKVHYEMLWQSPLFNPTGYAEEQKYFLEGIRPFPVRIKLQPIYGSDSYEYPSELQTYLTSLQNQSINQPLIHYQAAPANLISYPVAPISIGRTMFETDSLPPEWVKNLNEMTEVWVPSEFNRETFANAGIDPKRIYLMPGTLDERVYDPEKVQSIAMPNQHSFKFLSVFDWSVRKGWDVLLKAYFEEFHYKNEVSLILKITKINEPGINPYREIKELSRQMGLAQVPHVQIIQENLTEEELIRLYASVDCFVLPSRGEGWGRPYMEAMAMQLPTIGTKWSGQMAFMNDQNSYLLDVENLVPVDPEQMPAHFHGHRWANPSVDHLKQLMRYVFDHPKEAKKKGIDARRTLFPAFSRQRIGQRMYRRMDELVRSYFQQ
ncbi:glycosyltransferase [Risungbinella massiliensis]|uniref:glycosyltransferase n=1 Tax=Risungbinella massiliensis TaxID=1329796 RepID=UPI00069B166D|nr:glycosyltransferase [Risungbinella massiliensis]